MELLKRMVELQEQVYAVVSENRALKEKLGTREQLTFRKNAYWKGDDGPLCSRGAGTVTVFSSDSTRHPVTRRYAPDAIRLLTTQTSQLPTVPATAVWGTSGTSTPTPRASR